MSRARHPGARVALLLLALLGLLAMHGLAAHGTAGHHGAEPATVDAAAHAHPTATSVEPALAPATPLVPDDGTSAAGLCLAVLLLGLLALLVLRRGRPLLLPDRARVVAAGPAPPARDPDPPDLSRLCVLRC